MELKKSPKADLEKKKGLFLEIGMIISILVVIGVFSYSQAEKNIVIPEPEVPVVEAEVVEVTRQEERPPINVATTPVQVISNLMNIVQDDTEITTEMTFADFDDEAVFAANVDDYGVGGGTDGVADDIAYIIVEDMPKFMGGGLPEFRKWVEKQINYPAIAREMGIQGRVIMSFEISATGVLNKIEAIQRPDKSLSNELERILKLSPRWTPGKQGGKAVRLKYTLPITFSLGR